MADHSELVRKLRSQIGDDVREIYSPEALFKAAASAIEAQQAEIAALTARAEAAEAAAVQQDKLRAATFGTLKVVSAHLETATGALEEIADHDGGALSGLAFTAKTALREIGGGNG